MKKGKLLIASIITFLLTFTGVKARELNMKELIERVDTSSVDTIYVIGSHAFTSNHKLSTQDVMLAARTIENVVGEEDHNYTDYENDSIYKAMTMHKITITFDASDIDKVTGANVNNIFGDTTLNLNYSDDNKKYNIDYIDYKYVGDDTKVSDVKTDFGSDAAGTKLKNDFNFKDENDNFGNAHLTLANGSDAHHYTLSGTALYLPGVNEKYNDNDITTGYYFAYTLKIEGATENTTIKFILRDGTEKTVKFTREVADNFDEGTLSVLVAIDPSDVNGVTKAIHHVEIDKDGDDYHYDPYVVEIDYSGVDYQQVSNLNVHVDTTNDATANEELRTYLDTLGYKIPESPLEIKSAKGNNFTLEGTLVEQDLKEGALADNRTGYYFAFTINPNLTRSATKATVKISDKSGDLKLVEDKSYNADGTLNVVIALDPDAETKEFKIAIDLDGDEPLYKEVVYTYNYDGVNFQALSKVNIETDIFNMDDITSNLTSTYNFTKPENYSLSKDESSTKYEIVLTGLLPHMGKLEGELAETGYYLVYGIKLDKEVSNYNDLTINVDGKEFTATDVKYQSNNMLYVIKAITEEEKTNKLTIVVDLDGKASESKYVPTTYTIDLSKVKFEKESIATVSSSLNDNLKAAIVEKYDNYSFENEDVFTLVNKDGNYTITENDYINKQTGVTGFSNGEEYFVPISVDLSQYASIDNAKVTLTYNGSEVEAIKNDKYVGFLVGIKTADISTDTRKCTNCNLTLKVDIDNSGTEYKENSYTIDLTNLLFKDVSAAAISVDPDSKTLGDSLITVSALSTNKLTTNKALSGYIYSSKTDNEDYYLKYSVNPTNLNEKSIITVNGEQTVGAKITDKEIKLSDIENNKLTIVVDTDGDGEGYEPYTEVLDLTDVNTGKLGLIDFAYEETLSYKSIKYINSLTFDDDTDTYTAYVEKYRDSEDYKKNYDKEFIIYNDWYELRDGHQYTYCDYSRLTSPNAASNICFVYEKFATDDKWYLNDQFLPNNGVPMFNILGHQLNASSGKPTEETYYIERDETKINREDSESEITLTIQMTPENATKYFGDLYRRLHTEGSIFKEGQEPDHVDVTLVLDKTTHRAKKLSSTLTDLNNANNFKFEVTVSAYDNTTVDDKNSEIKEYLPQLSELESAPKRWA